MDVLFHREAMLQAIGDEEDFYEEEEEEQLEGNDDEVIKQI